jgi:hypothetical protein
MRRWRGIAVLIATTLLTACAAAPGVKRLSPSSLGCMRAVVREKLPQNLPDKQAHCLAAGLIAHYCSRSEAYLAGYGKEFTDIFDGGDPAIGDIKADLIGIRCAAVSVTTDALASCCGIELTRRHLPWTAVALEP